MEGSQWLQLKNWWYEEATLQARRNATRQPPGPVESELTGTGPHATLKAQAGLSNLALTQVKSIVLRA